MTVIHLNAFTQLWNMWTKKWQLKGELFTIIVDDLNCPLAYDNAIRKKILVGI